MRTVTFAALLLLSSGACADEGPAAVTPLPVSPQPVQAAPAQAAAGPSLQDYHLAELRPVSVSAYPTGIPTLTRNYLHFRNRDGNHYLVFEEESEGAPRGEVAGLQRSMANPNAECDVELSCRKKAICTGKCSNMYYQISSAAPSKAQVEQGREPAAAK
jgi:hypothetical protein